MNYKLLALDLDGTLLNRLKKISLNTIKVLNEFSTLYNCKIAILTGRSFFSSSKIIKMLEKKGIAISFLCCFNGAYNYNFETKTNFLKSTMTIEESNELKKLIDKHKMGFIAYPDNSHETMITYRSPGLITYSFCNSKKISAFKDFDSNISYFKINAISANKNKIMKFNELLKEHNHKFDYYMTSKYAIEINKKGINKGNSLRKITEILKINKDEIIAFGDSANDVPMFENSQHSFAMRNSNENIKKTALNISLDDNRNDGVAVTLLSMINRDFNFNREIKDIAIDLDGTLINSEHMILPDTISAVQRAERLGCSIIIATGRNLRDAIKFSGMLKLKNQEYLVVNNGAAVYDFFNKKFIYKSVLDSSIIDSIVEFLKTNHDHDDLFIQLMNYEGDYDSVISKGNAESKIKQNFLFSEAKLKFFKFGDKVDHSRVVKITVNVQSSKLAQIKKSLVDNIKHLEIINSDTVTIEITNIGVNKASGMQKIFRKNGNSFSTLLAMGDSENDLAMLKSAKYSYAVRSNNHSVMKQITNITKNGASKAVEEILEKELFGRKGG
jgi:Cof subfamily protein (haloacid dehalogenase superfamily)